MLSTLYSWYGRKTVWGVITAIVVLIIAGIAFKFSSTTEETSEEVLPVVAVASVSELGGSETLTLLGTVRSVSEANIETEGAGRVTSVPVTLGAEVSAGTVIATLENAAERAAVLQAEGVYEAAVAGATVSDISVVQAETAVRSATDGARNALQGAYTTVNNTFFGVIDQYYNDPTSPLAFPLLTDNNRSFLSRERVEFRTILPEWQSRLGNLNNSEAIYAEIDRSIEYTERTMALIDAFLGVLQTRKNETFNGESVVSRIATLNSARSSLANTTASLEAARTSLESAEDSFAKAEVGGTGIDTSVANAQIKQALGALRSAQANLAKTIITTPISGTINSLNVKVGDFVGAFTPVAKVANNNALEVTVFVGDADREAIEVDSEVVIDGKYPGIVTHIGAGIDAATQKTEVKIATETNELTNGDTVSVSLRAGETAAQTESSTLMLPISAVKFSAEDGFVLTVVDNTVVERPVEIGLVRGAFVEIISGIGATDEIVVDARGLTAGQHVTTN